MKVLVGFRALRGFVQSFPFGALEGRLMCRPSTPNHAEGRGDTFRLGTHSKEKSGCNGAMRVEAVAD